MFSTRFQAPCDLHVYITIFKMDGLGFADHEHWGMSIKTTQLVLDYSETLKRSRSNEEASVAMVFFFLFLFFFLSSSSSFFFPLIF